MRSETSIDYVLLFFAGLLLLLYQDFQPICVLYPLISILFTAATLLSDNPTIQLLILLGWAVLGLQYPPFFFFLPSHVRMTWEGKITLFWLGSLGALAFVPFLQSKWTLPIQTLVAALIFFAELLSFRYARQRKLYRSWLTLKDNSWEKERALHQKNIDLVQTQETAIELELSEERNRIARDIHDNVGHLLSSAIIQLGAIKTLNSSKQLEKPLQQLTSTVHAGMDNIRANVHNLYADSLPFEQALQLMIADFVFCPVQFSGRVPQNFTPQQKKVLLMIVKEALSNIMKHSKASEVVIRFDELPAFYRLQIRNDGVFTKEKTSGIGLTSMRQRMMAIGGQLHIHQKNNLFQLNAILPKEEQV